MNKVFVLPPNENWIVDSFVKDWYKWNSDISTTNIKEANVVWLLADWCWKDVYQHLYNKKVITSIHHIVPEKFDNIAQNDFYLRDQFTTIYHVYNQRVYEFVKRLTKKPIVLIKYWVNQFVYQTSNIDNIETYTEIKPTKQILTSTFNNNHNEN